MSRRKEHVQHARIMETKRATILTFRHWDSVKINNKLANSY
jgi:hypothetical protein